MSLVTKSASDMLIKSFLIWKERNHPEVKGLALGGIIAIINMLIHSITDFNLHIPANMLLFASVLSLTWVTVHYRYDPERNRRKVPHPSEIRRRPA